jgi:hypothetical protein
VTIVEQCGRARCWANLFDFTVPDPRLQTAPVNLWQRTLLQRTYGSKTMPAAAILGYIVLCLLTGFCGTHRRMGFWGTFFLALITTPLVVLPVLFITGPSRRFEWHPRD